MDLWKAGGDFRPFGSLSGTKQRDLILGTLVKCAPASFRNRGRYLMARSGSGPSLGKLGGLIVVLITGVLIFKTLSSVQLDLLSKQSHNRDCSECRQYYRVGCHVRDKDEFPPYRGGGAPIVCSLPMLVMSLTKQKCAYYEQLYPEAIDEIAEWRRRYDNESAVVLQQQKLLNKVEREAKHLREVEEKLKVEVAKLKEQLKRYQATLAL